MSWSKFLFPNIYLLKFDVSVLQQKVPQTGLRGSPLSSNKHFESSQKLRRDGTGIWENYVKLHVYAVYWYWYTVHTRSLINYVLSLSIPNFCFKMYTSEILYETESSFEIMLS